MRAKLQQIRRSYDEHQERECKCMEKKRAFNTYYSIVLS